MPQIWESNIKTSDKINKQNEQSSFILTHGTQKKTTTYDVGNPVHDLGQVQKCGEVKAVNRIPILWSW
jgi:hypothetical protein